MMKLVVHQFPVAANELLNLAEMMRSRDLLTPGFDIEDGDPYNPMTHLIQKEAYDTGTYLIADRNLVSRWLALGKSCKITEDHRVSAATLAFCQCCGILIEPNIAFYELAAKFGNEAANFERASFG